MTPKTIAFIVIGLFLLFCLVLTILERAPQNKKHEHKPEFLEKQLHILNPPHSFSPFSRVTVLTERTYAYCLRYGAVIEGCEHLIVDFTNPVHIYAKKNTAELSFTDWRTYRDNHGRFINKTLAEAIIDGERATLPVLQDSGILYLVIGQVFYIVHRKRLPIQ